MDVSTGHHSRSARERDARPWRTGRSSPPTAPPPILGIFQLPPSRSICMTARSCRNATARRLHPETGTAGRRILRARTGCQAGYVERSRNRQGLGAAARESTG